VEIPGVSNGYFMRTALNALRQAQGRDPIDAFDFLQADKASMKALEMDPAFLDRAVNEGFSGGEKKRNEILQMRLLEPRLAVLDETDSGLDIDALRVVAQGVNELRGPERGFLVITHYQRLLEHLVPDRTHVLFEGRIVRSGDRALALELEQRGYAWIAGAAREASA
jgi:Fe-S cluster assembly ATP-binding protein